MWVCEVIKILLDTAVEQLDIASYRSADVLIGESFLLGREKVSREASLRDAAGEAAREKVGEVCFFKSLPQDKEALDYPEKLG